MLQEIIVNLAARKSNNNMYLRSSSRDLAGVLVDVAMILSNGKIIAQDTPSNLSKRYKCKKCLFW